MLAFYATLIVCGIDCRPAARKTKCPWHYTSSLLLLCMCLAVTFVELFDWSVLIELVMRRDGRSFPAAAAAARLM